MESEERLRLAMEAGRMGAWEWRIPTQEVIWSESLERIHGLEPGGFEGTFEAFQRDMHPDDRDRVARTIEQSVAEGSHQVEYRIICPDGSVRWLSARGRLIRDDHGEPSRMIGVCTDITEPKNAAQEREQLFAELQSAEARYRNLFTGAGDTIVLTNSRAEVVDVNPAATALLGYTREELGGMHVSDVIDEGFIWSPEAVQRFVQGGEWNGELALRRKDGRLVDVEAKATAIFLPVGPIFVAVLRDVTERKAAEARFRELLEQSQRIQEELRLANESKDEFLGLVSHELRTPITTIFGGARLLRTRGERLDDQSKAEVLEDIERESERLHRIVEDLLVLARIELGQEITTEPVLVRRVVERAISTFSKRRPGRPIEIQADSRPSPVRASSVYLDQIMRNLINNADKYSPTGQPIDIWVRREGDDLVVSVMDRGPGISGEEMDLIFERFYRSGKTAGQASGAGIGLTVCKRLIEVQGGRIWANEREGGGLAISFALPVYDGS